MTKNVPSLVIVIPKDATPVIYEMLWPVSHSHGPFPIVCGPLPVPNWPPPFEALPRCECGGFHHHPNCTHVSRTMPPVEELKPRQYVPDYPPKSTCPWPHEEKWEDVCRRLRDDVLEEVASNLSRVTLVGDISGAVRKMKSEGK